MDKLLETYIKENSSKEDAALLWLVKQTHLRTNHGRMLCGAVEGKLLELISKMINPQSILEIGTFTGYSAICLARGLKDGGKLDALEINDELEDLIMEGFEKAGMKEKINLILGDAKESLIKLKQQNKKYDLIFIDANKREYPKYYKMVKEMVKKGGYIIADNVLWDGKVYQTPIPTDQQTKGINEFNKIVAEDETIESVIIPLRDGINLIRVK